MRVVFSLLLVLFVAACAPSAGAERVSGYYNQNGTYVQPYNRTSADSSSWNNYSTRGNTNPYTGQPGYTQPSYGGYQQIPYSNGYSSSYSSRQRRY